MDFFAISNNIPVHISDTQKGDNTILLLHGYLETLNVWEDLIPYFSSDNTDQSYRVVTIDLPGHGLTGTHPFCNSMEFCTDVIKGVLDKCNIDKCHLIGHSLGGYIGLKCLSKYPERFNSLVLLNSHPYPDTEKVNKDREREISFIQKGKLSMMASLSIPNMFFKENLRRMDDYAQMIISDCETHDPEGIISTVRGLMSREDMSEFLLSISDKALFIEGDNDYYYSQEFLSEIRSKFNKIKMEIIPQTGHNSFLESPEIVSKAILDFYTNSDS